VARAEKEEGGVTQNDSAGCAPAALFIAFECRRGITALPDFQGRRLNTKGKGGYPSS
jgi:hypothetical protein